MNRWPQLLSCGEFLYYDDGNISIGFKDKYQSGVGHMKNILVLGAGLSAPFMIDYLLKQAEQNDWFISVNDKDLTMAKNAIHNHPRGNSLTFDINDVETRQNQIEKSDVVISFLPPFYQYVLAVDCITKGKHLITASYQDDRINDINMDAQRKGILILNEMGLDPGIDHMSAMKVIQEVREKHGKITSFKSYGSGLPAPESSTNPLRYVITWNPRNVVMAGEAGAQYMSKNKIKILPAHEVFHRTWTVQLEGIGKLEAYPNRDSLRYRALLGLEETHTMIRGTLRYPGWSETWLQVVRLGLANEEMHIPGLNQYTYRDLVEMFLPQHSTGSDLEHRVANYLNIHPTGKIMDNLTWLGLFSDEMIKCNGNTASAVMIELLKKKLKLAEKDRDMVVILHEFEVEYPAEKKSKEKITSTFIEYGEPGGFTAMAKAVGLPAAIAAKMLLTGQLPLSGCHIPTHPAIYSRVLPELKKAGFKFVEKREVI
jgi:saccharopine dehydrogenase (NADP+, L-glutamate forming)